MSIQRYTFYEGGTIPGIPGTFHAGQYVDVDLETKEVIETHLINMQLDGKDIASVTVPTEEAPVTQVELPVLVAPPSQEPPAPQREEAQQTTSEAPTVETPPTEQGEA